LRQLRVFFCDVGTVQRGETTLIPLDLQRLRAFRRRPEVVGHDRDARADLDDVTHAWDGFRLVGVEAGHFAAENWTAHDTSCEQLLQLAVDGVCGSPVHCFRDVSPGDRAAV